MLEKILVTGASGFIGRQLVPSLVESGYRVVVGSRQGMKAPGATSQILPTRNGALDFDGGLGGVDTVIHLAGMAHFGRALLFRSWAGRAEFQKKIWQANVDSTESLAREAVRSKVRRLIYISSIGAVASSSEAVIRPDTPADPDSDYGKSKLAAEQILRQHLAVSATQLIIIRPPLIYGPGNVANMRRLILLVASGLPIPLALVKNRRSLLFIGNLVSLFEKILTHPGIPPWPILISDGEDLGTPELIRLLAEDMGRPTRLFPAPLSLMKAVDSLLQTETFQKLCRSLYLDMRATQDFYGWSPPFSLREGLRQTVAFYQARAL